MEIFNTDEIAENMDDQSERFRDVVDKVKEKEEKKKRIRTKIRQVKS